MSEAFIGEIRPFAFNFAPLGWAFCSGQLQSIAQNTALFSLLGTTYGGNGQTTFGLPDLQGRAPISQGQGPGLASYDMGQQGGTTDVTLTVSQLAAHTHLPQANDQPGDRRDPFSIVPAVGHRWAGSDHPQYAAAPADADMNNTLIGVTGSGALHPNESPYLAVNYCIALVGIYPARN